MPVKRWNFRKAKWSYYIALTNKFAKTLLPPGSLDVDAAYQDFCNTKHPKRLFHAVIETTIFRVEMRCDSIEFFLQSPQGDNSSLAAIGLLAKAERSMVGGSSEH